MKLPFRKDPAVQLAKDRAALLAAQVNLVALE
jgi:hypothetical protein